MTVDEVKALVLVVADKALIQDDNEAAHIAEDNLWRVVLSAIACGAPEPVRLAEPALRTCAIEYTRWHS